MNLENKGKIDANCMNEDELRSELRFNNDKETFQSKKVLYANYLKLLLAVNVQALI